MGPAAVATSIGKLHDSGLTAAKGGRWPHDAAGGIGPGCGRVRGVRRLGHMAQATQTLRALEAGAGRDLRSTAASAVGAVPQLAGRQAARLAAAARCSIWAWRPLMVFSTQRTPYR